MPDQPTLYTTQWCGYCVRLKRQLDRLGVPYREVDIEHDPAAAHFVASVNGGNQTVPTVRFADGTVATNPAAAEVARRAAEAAEQGRASAAR